MLQRKQTLFLILVIALMVPLYFLNLAYYEFFTIKSDNLFTISAVKATSGQTVYPLTILLSLIVALSVVVIALFKKTMLQMRLCVMLNVFILGFIGIEVYVVYHFFNSVQQFKVISEAFNGSMGVAAFLPIPALILAYMALKGITRDIFILRSYNKMR